MSDASAPTRNATTHAPLVALVATAKRANSIVAATNHADLEDPSDVFDAVHDMANDLTISTQRAVARALGWIGADGGPTEDAGPLADELLHGIASSDAMDALVHDVTTAPKARPLLGWQIADHMGEGIQGEAEDPSGFPSFRILSLAEAEEVVRANPNQGLLLMPIREGDIEGAELPPSRIAAEG